MTDENLATFGHIEIVHPDPASAVRFLIESFGAKEVATEISKRLVDVSPAGTEIAHALVGGVVFQFIKPAPEMESWWNTLAAHGPTVHNVAVMINGSISDTRDRMVAQGSSTLVQFGGMRAAEGGQPTIVVDSREQVGLVFEMIEDAPIWDLANTP